MGCRSEHHTLWDAVPNTTPRTLLYMILAIDIFLTCFLRANFLEFFSRYYICI
jgi:hypothetical protein